MTVLVPSTLWMSPGMTLSRQSWPSPELPRHGRAGRYTIGLMQDFSCIDLWFDVGDLSGISPAYLSFTAVASRQQ